MTEQYGYVHAINLLGTKDAEASLTAAYARHLQIAKGVWGDDIDITHYDFHQAVRVAGHDNVMRDFRFVSKAAAFSVFFRQANVRWYRRLNSVSDNIDRFGFTMCDASSEDMITEQKGIFRTNCLDWYEICGLSFVL